MEKKELEQLYEKVSKERNIAQKKLREAKRLYEECQEEFDARTGFLFAIERLLNLKE